MKRSQILKGCIAALIVLIFGLSIVGCVDPGNGGGAPVDKTELNAELALEITAQGDYTLDSYNAYLAKLSEAKSVASNEAADQSTVNRVTTALTAARLALELRPVDAIAGANKQINLTSGDSAEIVIADYIDTNDLSNITYKALASNEIITLSEISNGRFTITAGKVNKDTTVKVAINVYQNGNPRLTVELSVKIVKDELPTLISESIVREYDMFESNIENITIDFAENVNNDKQFDLNFSVKRGEEDVTLNGTSYTFTFGTYTEKATYETFTVTVSYVSKGEEYTLEYTYTLVLRDTSSYSVANGGFENGLNGWTQVGNIGSVSSDTHYWLNDPERAEGYPFGMDGEKMFSAYAPGALESAVGTLTSSTFKIGGSGFITFKIGAMRDQNYVYVDIVDAGTKEILARYYNGLWADRTADVKSGCTLVAYKADLSEFLGREVFIRISDNAESGYGLFFADSFVTYYENEPDGFYAATPVTDDLPKTMYDLFNGGFEMGDVQGWWNDGQPGHVTDANEFFNGREYGKHGNFLYSGVEDHGAGNGLEGNRGILTSSMFEIGGTGFISFMLGGGENALCYVQVIDAVTGEVLARYHQQEMDEAVLKQYIADLSAYIGRTARIQVVDYASSGWGCVSFDNVVTYYASVEDLPVGITAIDIKGNVKYNIENGSFETGNLDGWTMNITEPGVHNTLGWVLDAEHDAEWYTKNDDRKDGNFLFTFVKPGDINCESSKGTLDSSVFTLKANSYVSFRFGGAGTRDVYVQLCRADGSVIATFYNEADGKQNTEMYAYYYQYQGEEVECFFRVVDNSTSNYGCFVVDDFRVNLESAPEGYMAAIQ